MHTKDHLAAELTKAELPDLAAKATRGDYNTTEFPNVRLEEDLRAAATPGALVLLHRHTEGEFVR